ncbi:glycosyltransferase [Pseudokineococcus sp. 1T1Z-3]|uniref:glycosyltransferase n=1 Tax=Pseudokineococcus sp. 1T1Z-3 TaxID=3132745 RepID=UPI0030B56570
MTVSAVIPVRDLGELLEGALASLEAQSVPVDEVVLVDDGPSATIPEDPSRYRVVRSGGVGPYAARNLGWRAATGDVVLFLDARSRPRPRWAGELAALLAREGVGLAGCDVHVVAGRSLASRVAALEQPFALGDYVGRAWFRPYLATCSLAVRREVLEATGGFAATRSGADADLCWRAQDLGWRLEAVPEVLLDWLPRDSCRDLLEQHYRYGRSNTHLRRAWAAAGAQQPVVPTWPAVARMAALAGMRTVYAVLRRREDRLLHSLVEAARVATRLGVRRAVAEASALTPAAPATGPTTGPTTSEAA